MTIMIDHVHEGCTCGGKRCPDCKQIKCHEPFNHNKSTTNGLYVYCRKCQRTRNTVYYSQHRTPSRAEIAMRENAAVEHVTNDCTCGGKWCPGYEQVKCHGTFNRSNRRDGFQTYCRICHGAHLQAYRKAHPDKMREMDRAYTQSHGEACRVRYKRYRDAHPERVKQATERWKHEKLIFIKSRTENVLRLVIMPTLSIYRRIARRKGSGTRSTTSSTARIIFNTSSFKAPFVAHVRHR
jgi:hypothetical protein